MVAVWSKAILPLGAAGFERGGRGRVVLFEPLQSQPDEECPICLCELRWGEHLDLPCGHHGCRGCLLQHAVSRFKNGSTFSCPLCRSTAGHLIFEVDCATTPLPSIASNGIHRVSCVADVFSNWHTYLVESADSGACFVHSRLLGGRAPRLPAYPRSQTIFIDPYHGWIVPDGVPSHNTNFRVVERGSTCAPYTA